MNARWTRLEGLVDLDVLAAKHVVVVGLGSGGSTVALELARAGVGRFTLVDPDRLDTVNLVRHECDERYVGCGKAASVAELIHFRNPAARVHVLPVDVFTLHGRLEAIASEADLVAACTDVEPPKRLLNRVALVAGIPAVYAGVYERGVGGEVIRCGSAHDDPCYACVTSVLKEAAPPPVTDAELDYGAVDTDGVVHDAPGLGLDVRSIALIHARVCLWSLLGQDDELPGNVVLFGTAAVDDLFPRPYANAVLDVAPQVDCLVCTPLRRLATEVR